MVGEKEAVMLKLILGGLLIALMPMVSMGQVVQKTFADLPVRDVANGGREEGLRALADAKCLGVANALMVHFAAGKPAMMAVADVQVRVRGDLYAMPRFDDPIRSGVEGVAEVYKARGGEAAWEAAFSACQPIVRDADEYDWSEWNRDKSRFRRGQSRGGSSGPPSVSALSQLPSSDGPGGRCRNHT